MSQSPPKRALCVLHLEDSPEDRELVQEMFANEGVVCDFRPVETRAAFEAALEKGECELILSDYSLPGFDGMTALALAHARRPEVPFIFISGVMGEERAIESMKNGATDYVLKERIDRLLPSVRRAMREVEERRQLQLTELRLRQSEEQLRQITENVSDWILVFDLEGRCTYSNPAYQRALDVLPTPAAGHFWERLAERDAAVLRAEFNELVLKGIARRLEVRLQSGGAQRYVEAQFNLVCDEKGARKSVVLVCRDITVRRMAEEQMRAQSAILDQTQDAIVICNSEENIVYWNPSATQLYGWSADEVRGRNLHALLHPTPQPTLAEAKRVVQREGEWHGELRQLSK